MADTIDYDALAKAAAIANGITNSAKRIAKFEEYCVSELGRAGLPPAALQVGRSSINSIEFDLVRGDYSLGGYYPKEIDVALFGRNSGPLLGISLKAMWRSVGKNVNNRWEEMVGDAANLHNRFPMLALGYVMVLPFVSTKRVRVDGSYKDRPEPLMDAIGQPTDLARAIVTKLSGVTGRSDPTDIAATYEAVAICFFDFSKNPPQLHPTFPTAESSLRIDNFFARLAKRFWERNKLIPERPIQIDEDGEGEESE